MNKCMLLINSDFNGHYNDTCISLTATTIDTSNNKPSICFDYNSVINRQKKFGDVAGFYHEVRVIKNNKTLINYDIMKQWVASIGCPLVYLLNTNESLNGMLFFRENDKIIGKNIRVTSTNNVNFNVSLDNRKHFWSSLDSLTKNNNHDSDIVGDILQHIDDIDNKLIELSKSNSNILSVINNLIETKQLRS